MKVVLGRYHHIENVYNCFNLCICFGVLGKYYGKIGLNVWRSKTRCTGLYTDFGIDLSFGDHALKSVMEAVWTPL